MRRLIENTLVRKKVNGQGAAYEILNSFAVAESLQGETANNRWLLAITLETGFWALLSIIWADYWLYGWRGLNRIAI